MTDRLGETMNWSRLMGVMAAGLVLGGCATSASTTEAARSPKASAHDAHPTGAHRTAGHGKGGSTSDAKAHHPLFTVVGNLDARPGQLVVTQLDGVACGPGDAPVVATSPAFRGPVRLHWQNGSCGSTSALAMTAKPGSYPLSITVAGRTVARDKIKVVRSRRPSLSLTPVSEVARPGAPVWLYFDDLYPGERGTHFTVRSAALSRTVRLAHDRQLDFYNPRTFQARPQLRPGLADGTYTFELRGPHGRHIMEKRLTVRASRPGDPDYLGKAHGPDLYQPGTYADSPHRHSFRVARGGKVEVMWHDVNPDPGEEMRLTATSPAFTHVLHLRADDSKSADGDDPRFLNTATIRADLEPGRYPVTVVAHHGRVKKVGYVIVTAR
ncbi:hypothetical protein [Streptomyces bugieae]|uniref:Lipoprotein n=1 Tax=Streptomyces bugieae TaxID=3098223 RepID=A0ABU7NJL9_9ACTN|nr:hypothetical protein [Streptomyces sp. DSM 41528]